MSSNKVSHLFVKLKAVGTNYMSYFFPRQFNGLLVASVFVVFNIVGPMVQQWTQVDLGES